MNRTSTAKHGKEQTGKGGKDDEGYWRLFLSDYGIENGYVDYATLGEAVDHVLKNDAIGWLDDWEPISGDLDAEVMQWYIVSSQGAEFLQECGESVWYSPSHDLYLWAVTHLGTSWDYILTDIPCMVGYED